MRITDLMTGAVYEMHFKNSGENRIPCPKCSHTRRKKKDPCLAFNAKTGVGFCHHCDSRFIEHKPYEEKNYVKPKWENYTALNDNQLKWFEGRMISQNTLKKMKVSYKLEYMPQVEKQTNCIAFPYFKAEELTNIKFRDGAKNFKLNSGSELIWYNYNSLLENKEIIITEGEIDALSFIEDGFENVISVPNGASKGKMEYLDNSIELFDSIDKVYIAVDVDEKGIILKDELVRRLGAEKCFICNFREFKDANEYLVGKGRKSLLEVLKTAKQTEVEGIVNLKSILPDIKSLYKNGLQKGKEIGCDWIDEYITWELGRLAIFTGTPSSGKSEFVDFISVKLNVNYGWKVAYWSPENRPLQYHYSKISEKINGSKFDKTSCDVFWSSFDYINDNFYWIDPEEPTLDNVLKKFKFYIKSKGVKIIVLDPFANLFDEIDYKKQGKMLTKISLFARQHNVLFMLVAHPRKLEKNKEGHFPMPSMYDISGSSDFWNRADYGIGLRREQEQETNKFLNYGQIAVHKIKFKHLGKQGGFEFKYNYNNGRYEDMASNINQWDMSNWLIKEEKKETPKVIPQEAFEKDDDLPF